MKQEELDALLGDVKRADGKKIKITVSTGAEMADVWDMLSKEFPMGRPRNITIELIAGYTGALLETR